MKIYFAGASGSEDRERDWSRLIAKRLLSYWSIQQNQAVVKVAFGLVRKQYEDLPRRWDDRHGHKR